MIIWMLCIRSIIWAPWRHLGSLHGMILLMWWRCLLWRSDNWMAVRRDTTEIKIYFNQRVLQRNIEIQTFWLMKSFFECFFWLLTFSFFFASQYSATLKVSDFCKKKLRSLKSKLKTYALSNVHTREKMHSDFVFILISVPPFRNF